MLSPGIGVGVLGLKFGALGVSTKMIGTAAIPACFAPTIPYMSMAILFGGKK